MDPNIDRMAATILGAAPATSTPPQPVDPAAATPPAQRDTQTPTATEKAIEATAPNDEGNRASDEPIAYDVEVGGAKRRLTPQQIAGTYERYASLNHEHARLKPLLDAVRPMIEAGADPAALAEGLAALAKGDRPAVMGNGAPAASDQGAAAAIQDRRDGAAADPFKTWEEENAASLPPRYREMLQAIERLPGMMAQVLQVVQQGSGAALGATEATRAAATDINAQRAQALRQSIANNLDRAAASLRLTNDAAKDFEMFAAERGFTIEDFADPDMTHRVMSDFAAVRQTPEMQRLRAIAERRQAYTGSLASTPTAGAPSAAAPETPSPLNAMIEQAMSRRMG